MTDGKGLFTGIDTKKRRAERSNYLNYPESIINHLEGTTITDVVKLGKDGLTRKDTWAILERSHEKAWEQIEEANYEKEELPEDVEKALEKIKSSKENVPKGLLTWRLERIAEEL